MSFALLKIAPGCAPHTKRRLIDSVSLAMADSLALPLHEIRVLVEEYPTESWSRGSSACDTRCGPLIEPTAAQVAEATAKLLAN